MKVWEDSTKIMGRLMYDQDAGPEWVNKPPNPNEIPYSQRTVQLQYGFTASYSIHTHKLSTNFVHKQSHADTRHTQL